MLIRVTTMLNTRFGRVHTTFCAMTLRRKFLGDGRVINSTRHGRY